MEKEEEDAPQVYLPIGGDVAHAKVLTTGAGGRGIALVRRASRLCIAASPAKIFSAVTDVSY
jgi:hypothetical protein